jgi:hypothetical protein
MDLSFFGGWFVVFTRLFLAGMMIQLIWLTRKVNALNLTVAEHANIYQDINSASEKMASVDENLTSILATLQSSTIISRPLQVEGDEEETPKKRNRGRPRRISIVNTQ